MALASASASLSFRISSIRSDGSDAVYIATIPLRATKGPSQLLMSAAYSLNFWDFQHFMVIMKSSSTQQVLVYDFQPRDPENILVALAALSGREVSGVIQVRHIRELPKKKCWFVGYSKTNAFEAATKFNNTWETNLKIGVHDCRNYSEGLVELLTGESEVLDRLRDLYSTNK